MGNNLYKGQCGSCVNYLLGNLNEGERDGYGCVYNGRIFGSPHYKRYPFDHTCGGYKLDKSRTDDDIKKAYKRLDYKYGYRPNKSSWWYIATFIRDTLGKDVCEDYFLTIAHFRNNILEKNIVKYASFLVDYDIYGRLIANSLYQDEQKLLIAQDLLANYIIPTCQFINNQEYDEAFGLYRSMFEKLKELYNITSIQDYDFNNTTSLTSEQLNQLKRKLIN